MSTATPVINGLTSLIAHIGHPTGTFRSPQIYNPYFASIGANVVVVPMDCRAGDLTALVRGIFALDNLLGALITMPHKVSVVELLDIGSSAVQMAGSCNAIRRDDQGRLVGEMFDGEGFVRGLARRGVNLEGRSAMVLGCGGVGSAIAVSLAGASVGRLLLSDANSTAQASLEARLRRHFPTLEVHAGLSDPFGMDLVVNATPLGMNEHDPLPLDPQRLSAGTVVGDVVLSRDTTPLLCAAKARGCLVQSGFDMLFEQIPAYLEFFGLPTTTSDVLRQIASGAG